MKTLQAVLVLLVGCGGPFSTAPSLTGDGGREAVQAADAGPQSDDAEQAGTLAHDDAADAHDGAQLVDVADAAPDTGPTCITDLSGVGTSDFRIAFTLETTTHTAMALVDQNGSCQQACGGAASVEWDMFVQGPTGGVLIETDDGTAADRVFAVSGQPVNDGVPHHIEAGRVAGLLWVKVDGQSSAGVPDTNALDVLPELVVGRDPCASSAGNAGCPAVLPLDGMLTELCVSRL